ncbi:MAG: flagellar biosynthetic protein FliO [Myxococcota bacterium]
MTLRHLRLALLGLSMLGATPVLAGEVNELPRPAPVTPPPSDAPAPTPATTVTPATPAAAPAPTRPAKEPPLGFEPEDLRGIGGSAADGLAGAWAIIVKSLVALCAVLMVIYLVLGKGLARMAGKMSAARTMRVVDRLGLDARRTLYLVEVDGVRALVGTGENQMSMMVLPPAAPARAADFAETLGQTAARHGVAATEPQQPAPDEPHARERGDA